jgi:hypothetical protein
MLRHLPDNLHRLHADCTHAAQQINNLFAVIPKPIGVELLRNRGVFGFLFLVALQNPLQRRICAETIFPRFRRGTAQAGLYINLKRSTRSLKSPSTRRRRMPASISSEWRGCCIIRLTRAIKLPNCPPSARQ